MAGGAKKEKKFDRHLQAITAYFLSDVYRDRLAEVQGRYPELCCIERRPEKTDARRKTTKAHQEPSDGGAPIDPVTDAAMDMLLKAAKAAGSGGGGQVEKQYEMPLFHVITIAEMHYEPVSYQESEPPYGEKYLSYFPADDHEAARYYAQIRPQIQRIRDNVPGHDSDAIDLLDKTLRCIDEFVNHEATLEKPAQANAAARGITKKSRPRSRKKGDEATEPLPPEGHSM